MTEKQLLALMTALIYGQSKTLTGPECFKVAADIWQVVNEGVDAGWTEEETMDVENPKRSGAHIFEADLLTGGEGCRGCGLPAENGIHTP